MQSASPVHTLLQSGFDHQRQGRLLEAEKIYRAVLKDLPDQPDALFLLGTIAATQGALGPALDLLTRSINLQPSVPKHLELGKIWQQTQRPDLALGCCDAALALIPDHADACAFKGSILLGEGRFEESVAWLEKANAQNPGHRDILNNLGLAYSGTGETAKALSICQNLVKEAPDNFSHHANLAVAHLVRGEFKLGFKEYQWRWQLPQFQAAYPWKLWTGEDIKGKTLLVHGEHGFGDAIQFSRYVTMAAEKGAKVILRVPSSLVRIMSSLKGVDKVLSTSDALPPIDFHCSMMDLPAAFGTEPTTIPANIPYLFASPADCAEWKKRIPEKKGETRVGLVWAGAPNKESHQLRAKDRRRSMPARTLSPLSKLEHFRFYSLQKEGEDQSRDHSFIDLMDQCKDFADTAALIMQLDLVISVDTSVAHLAGALGKPVWLMNRHDTCWRWLTGREDTPWYPKMRIFRQKKSLDWPEVIDRIVLALKGLSVPAQQSSAKARKKPK